MNVQRIALKGLLVLFLLSLMSPGVDGAFSNTVRQIIKGSGTTDTASSFVVNFTAGTDGLPLLNTSKAFHVISIKNSVISDQHAATFRSSAITSTTELTIYASGAAITRNHVAFEYTVIEFTESSPMTVQQSRLQIAASSVVPINQPNITDVGNASQAFLLHQGHNHNASETTIGFEEYDRVRLLNASAWEYAVGGAPNTGPQDNRVAIVDWNDGDYIHRVQRDVVLMPDNMNNVSVVPPEAVSQNRTLLFVSVRTGTSGSATSEPPSEVGLSAELVSNGSIFIIRNSAGPNLSIAWELVEFRSDPVRVQHKIVNITSGSFGINVSISPARFNMSAAFGTVSTPFGHGGAASNDTTLDNIANHMFAIRMINSTVVEVTRNSSTGLARLGVQIIEFVNDIDLTLNSSDIVFNLTGRVEGENITANITVRNTGTANASNVFLRFLQNDNIVGNTTVNVSGNSSLLINTTFVAVRGNNTFLVAIDPNDAIGETNETNNNASTSFNVSAHHILSGSGVSTVVLGLLNQLIISFGTEQSVKNILAMDSDSSVAFANLQALGKRTNGSNSSADFSEADTLLNLTAMDDSLFTVYSTNNVPKETQTFTVAGTNITNVPVTNNSATSALKTGILWDTGDDTNGEYNITDAEDIVFIMEVNISNYEIRIPATLQNYKAGTASVALFLD